MSTISQKDIEYIAHLARIGITADEMTAYSNELSNILELVEQMNAVDTSNIEPLAHPLELTQRLRQDVITETDQHQLFQQNAPLVESDLYLVPKVIDEA